MASNHGRKKRTVSLKARERRVLEQALREEELTTRERVRARILLLSHEGWDRESIATATGSSTATVGRVRRRYCEAGMKASLGELPRPGARTKMGDREEQRVVALACTDPPKGYARWSIRLLTAEAIQRGLVPKVSRERIRIVLREHGLKPWREKVWCIPELDDEFVERMEDLLRLYERPLNPEEPVVCLDEKPVQCLDEKRKTIRVRNGSYRRDYEYVRRGTANVFCALEPKAGRHFTRATPNRKKPAFARMLRRLANAYPSVQTIHLVMDNLSTHTKRALTDTFGISKGEKLWSRFTVHYTPKHGSWLDQAEIAIGIFSRQCLGTRRIGSFNELRAETAAWRKRVDRQRLTIDWKFTVADARRKFDYSRRRGKIKLSGH